MARMAPIWPIIGIGHAGYKRKGCAEVPGCDSGSKHDVSRGSLTLNFWFFDCFWTVWRKTIEISGNQICPNISKIHIKSVHRDSGNSFYVKLRKLGNRHSIGPRLRILKSRNRRNRHGPISYGFSLCFHISQSPDSADFANMALRNFVLFANHN